MSVRGEVENLMNRWCWAMDERDADALKEIYTADARLTSELPDREPTTIDGRDAILAYLAEVWGRVPQNGVKHVFTTYDIEPEVDGDVRLRSYFISYRLVEGRPAVSSLGHQTALARRDGDGWRIAERVHHVDGWLAT